MRSHHTVECTSFIPLSIIIFNIIPDHTDAPVPSWQELKNSLTTENRLLHVHPLINSHFHLFIIVESVAAQARL